MSTSESASTGPLVSVVMIFRNAEAFIAEAIESVLGQTYKSWELLLVDDGSSDASSGIARHYAARYATMMRYLEHPRHKHRGTGGSRKLGSDQAKGVFVAFLDADDVWLPHKLEQQVAILESEPEAAMVYGRALFWHGWTGDPDDIRQDQVAAERSTTFDTLIQPPTLLPLYLRSWLVDPYMSSTLVRRQTLERVRGFDARFRGAYEDAVLIAKLFLEHPVYISRQCWHKFRRHPQSYTSSFPYRRLLIHRKTFYEWLARYLWERGIRGGEVWAVVLRELGQPHHHPILHPVLYQLETFPPTAFNFARSVVPQPVRRPVRRVLNWFRSTRRAG